MTILVTGGCGFIGSVFVKTAINRNYKVVNIDALTYASNAQNLHVLKANKDYIFVRGNICDNELVASLLNKYKPMALINFAAETHVDRSIKDSERFIETNVLGTHRLLEQVRIYKEKDHKNEITFFQISTDEVFGELGEKGNFNELSPYKPNSPYSSSKAAGDHLVRAWKKTYNLPIIITNCSNNYGPFQNKEKLIPLIITNALAGKPLPIYGKGLNVRDWLFVEDHVDAILCILENAQRGTSFNIGGDCTLSNIELVKKICKLLDNKVPRKTSYAELITFVSDRPGHDFRYSVDCSKIKRELNWNKKFSLEKGLNVTIDWYLKNVG